MLPDICGIEKNRTNQLNQMKNRHTHAENKLVAARVEGGWGRNEMGEGDQEVQTPRYKINKPWGCNTLHGVCSQ